MTKRDGTEILRGTASIGGVARKPRSTSGSAN